jgi:Apea-like HEPN
MQNTKTYVENPKQETFLFEILCIEPLENDIQNEPALLKALAFSNRLWNGSEPKEINGKSIYGLSDPKLHLNLFLKSLDTSKMLTAYSEAAFIIHIEGKDFDALESFRIRLLRHLKTTLGFTHLRILTDDISTFIANRLYPEINKVESLLRRYLTKFFIQRVGINWWEATATRLMIEKVKMRGERKDDFSELIAEDVALVDFDDLGELIYKQTSGFNQPEKIITKILSLQNLDELRHFKNELQGNYTKYFKDFFQDKHFEPRWKELLKIRNKVAHQGAFFMHDLERGLNLAETLSSIITEAESKIDEIVFSIEEKEAIRQASIEAATDIAENKEEAETQEASNYFRGGLQGLKIMGKIYIPEKDKYLTEEEAIDELEEALSSKYNYYVGFKWFATTYLKNKNYVVTASYSLLNILIDKEIIEVYDVRIPEGFDIKAIRFTQKFLEKRNN